jgi:hypothetical protein
MHTTNICGVDHCSVARPFPRSVLDASGLYVELYRPPMHVVGFRGMGPDTEQSQGDAPFAAVLQVFILAGSRHVCVAAMLLEV